MLNESSSFSIKESEKKKKNSLKVLSLFKKISKSFTNVHDLDLNSDPDLDLDSDLFFPVQILDSDPELHQN